MVAVSGKSNAAAFSCFFKINAAGQINNMILNKLHNDFMNKKGAARKPPPPLVKTLKL
jgi:hypothetical protein